MDAGGGHAREVTHNDVEETQPELSPDNTRILFLAETNEKLEPYYNSNALRGAGGGRDAEAPAARFSSTRSIRLPGRPTARRSWPSPTWACTARSSRSTRRTRQWKPLTNGDHYIPPTWSVVPQAGQMVFQFDEPTRFGDVWTLAIPATRTAAAAAPVRVTGVFDTLDRRRSRCRARRRWRGRAPTARRSKACSSIRPTTSAGRRYPLVVQMHGGPEDSDKFGAGPGLLLNYFPVLTGKGYAVLRPNYRGSTGYGNAFLRDVVGGYFKNMHLDVHGRRRRS